MPVYVYKHSGRKKCTICGEGFEVRQSMSEEPLAKCPECGAPVKRIITGVNIRTGPSTKSVLSNKSLKQHGFHKLVREEKGVYRKDV